MEAIDEYVSDSFTTIRSRKNTRECTGGIMTRALVLEQNK